MSLQFSDTTGKDGIIQRIEDACGFPDGGISGNATLLAKFTAKVNTALDKVTRILVISSGEWQWDDTNHSTFPEVFATLAGGTRRYSFTADSNSNLILAIHKVFVRDASDTSYIELEPVDSQSQIGVSSLTDGKNASGTPQRYDKTGKWIDLDPVPNYTVTSTGIKVLIDREASYFATSDTTKVPGIPPSFHEYLYLAPSYEYARDKSLPNRDTLYRDMRLIEEQLEEMIAIRGKDSPNRMTSSRHDNR